MSFYGLKSEYALKDSSNYIAWKDMMGAVLEDNGLKEFIDHDISKPPTFDAKDMVEWRKCVTKARRKEFEIIFSQISTTRKLHLQCGRH